MEKLTVYIKENNKYIETYSTDNKLEIYENLCNLLISKKINRCKWCKSIKRVNYYYGYQEITAYMLDGAKYVYIVKERG
jgi:hypothetical protein